MKRFSLDDIINLALSGDFLGRMAEEYLNWVVKKNRLKKPSKKETDEMAKKVIKELQQKYPNAGIILKKD